MHIAIPFCTSIPAPGFYQDFVAGIEAAAARLGHSSERIGFAAVERLAQPELDRFFAWSRHARCDLVIDLCGWGYGLSRVRLWNADGSVGATLFDSLGAQYCVVLADQPYYQPLPWVQSERLRIACPDRGHPALIGALYPALAAHATVFVPPATRVENDRSPARWSDRREGALYIGNLAPHTLERFWSDSPQRSPCDALADALLAEPQRPLADLALESLAGPGGDLPLEDRLEVLRSIELWWRQQLRHRLVTAVARSGVPLRVCGRGWDALELPRNVTLLPETGYPGFLELIGSAQLALDASTYPAGANDRVFNFAINGTPFLTNASGWLAEAFGVGGGALFYDAGNMRDAGERVGELLADPGGLRRRGESGRATALGGHLWEHRLRTIIAAASGT